MVRYAEKSVKLTDGTDAGRETLKQLAEIESILHKKCREIPYAENILAINGVGENILSRILAEMGDICSFDVKEIQKLIGMRPVTCSSGKHKGQTRIRQTASILAVLGDQIGVFPTQKNSSNCMYISVLHNRNQQSVKKDAVIDRDSLQDTKHDIHSP